MRRSCENIKDKIWCINQYITLKKSIKQIRRETGLGINTIKRWFTKHNIDIRQKEHEIIKSQKSKKLKDNPNWKGKKSNCGYRYIYCPDHPNALKSGYINEHRFVVEKNIGRLLTSLEVIHHIDMDKASNGIDNLFVLSRGKHKKAHLSFNKLCKELLKRKIIYFDREEGIYKYGCK